MNTNKSKKIPETNFTVTVQHEDWEEGQRRISEVWRENGSLHNPYGPAVRYWNGSTGNLTYEAYFQDSELHRIDGPALVEFDPKTGEVIEERWSLNGEDHRLGDRPAHFHRDAETGVITYEAYLVAGILHRENGPALIERDQRTGTVTNEEYYKNGHKVDTTFTGSPPAP